MKPANFPGNKERRQREAKERQAAYEKLSLREKLDRAIARGGKHEIEKLSQSMSYGNP